MPKGNSSSAIKDGTADGGFTLLLLQIDANMMSELREVQATVQPSDTLLVVDAMTGQEAAGLVKAFNEAAEITGAPYEAVMVILPVYTSTLVCRMILNCV